MSRQRIMVVEEDDLVREFIARTLSGAGFFVQAFPSGSDGLAYLEETPDPFALMVVDGDGPNVNGLEFLRKARQVTPNVGSFLLTSYGTIDSVVKALELGISGFVMKPVTPEQLVEAVKGAITRSASSHLSFRLKALEALDEMSGIILTEKDEELVVHRLLELVAREVRTASAAAFFLDSQSNELVLSFSVGGFEDDNAHLVLERLQTAWVSGLDRAMGLPSEAEGRRELVSRESGYERGFSFYLPVLSQGQLLGVLAVTRQEASPSFTQGDKEFLCIAACLLGLSLKNWWLEKEIENRREELQQGKVWLDERIREVHMLRGLLWERPGEMAGKGFSEQFLAQ